MSAVYARLQMKLPFFTDEHGTLHAMDVQPALVDVLCAPECEHSTTLCSDCFDDWTCDYDLLGYVVLTDDEIIPVLPEE
jgi:hypothetical protein